MKPSKTLAAALATALLGASLLTAEANTLTPTPLLTPTPGAWTYQLDLTSGILVAGDGFCLYDFTGYVAGSIIAPVNWTASVSLVGGVPPGVGVDITGDDPLVFNLCFTYTGPTITQTTGSTVFLGFGATTTATSTRIDGWGSIDHLLTGGIFPASGTILAPAFPGVPEGGSALAFLGLALVAVEALRRKLAS